jgi:hypothetical protein
MCRHDCLWNCSTPGALSDVIANTSNDTDLVTTSEKEFDYTLIGMDTQPRTIPSEWTDNGREEKSHETHDENHSDLSDDARSEESDYEKQKAKRARKARPPRSHSLKPKSSELKSNERPKRNKATTRLQQYNAERSARSRSANNRTKNEKVHSH